MPNGVTLPPWAKGANAGGGASGATLPPWAKDTNAATIAALPAFARPHKPGLSDKIARYTGAELVGHLGKDIGEAAIGIGPGLYQVGKASGEGYLSAAELALGNEDAARRHAKPAHELLKGVTKSYADYYGHNVLSHLYNHPLQPILDALTVADAGATAGAKAGLLSGERATLVTRSPRAIAEGKGPVHTELTSTKPLVRARETALHKLRIANPEGFVGGRVAGEVRAFGKGVQQTANQHALAHIAEYAPYLKITRRFSQREWAAHNIRAMDVHPADLAEIWKGTPNEKWVTDPKVQQLVQNPTKRLVAAENEARRLSGYGEELGLKHGFLTEHVESLAKPPPGLVRLRGRTARLEKLHGKALERAEANAAKLAGPEDAVIGKTVVGPGTERVIRSYRTIKPVEPTAPVTEAGARARLAALEKKHAKFHEQLRVSLFGDKLSPGDLAEQRFRNVEKGKAIKQQSSAANKSTHGTYKHKIRKTVKQEQLDEAIKNLDRHIEANPDAPHVKAYLAEEGEIATLRDALNPLPGDKIDLARARKAMQGETPATVREVVKRSVRGPGRVIAARGSALADRLGGALSVSRDELARAEEKFARTAPPPRIGGTVQRVDLPKRTIAAALGRPAREIHGQPYYVPHVIDENGAVNPLGGRGGGKAQPQPLGASKRNEGTLFLHGKMALRRDILGPDFLRRVKFIKYDEIHNALARGAVRVTKKQLEDNYDGRLPKNYEYLRVKPSDHIPATMRGESDIPAQLQDGFTTVDPALAKEEGGVYYIVPSSLAKAATGEFTKVSEFQRAFIHKPLAVWRAIVLGLRVGFLTNNFVGNSIMYAVRTAGTGALRDLFKSILEQHGANVAKKALDSAATPTRVRKSFYEEFFPEQVAGTFGRTQSPTAGKLATATSHTGEVFRATTSAIPNLTSKVAEVGYRRALIRNFIRRSPEFKTVYRALPKETRTFEEAARKVLDGKGGKVYQRYISKQVNRSLGNYLNLSPIERHVLRNALPFYAWYKAIVVTTAHLAVDTPLRANILGQIGQIGKQWSDDKLGAIPSFLEGAIPLGKGPGGTTRALSTQGANPYATLAQLRSGAGGDISSLGLNPFVTAILDSYANARQKSFNVSGSEVLTNALANIAKNLPLAQLAEPSPPSALYPTRGRRTTAFSFLGVPVKEFNPAVAADERAQGR